MIKQVFNALRSLFKRPELPSWYVPGVVPSLYPGDLPEHGSGPVSRDEKHHRDLMAVQREQLEQQSRFNSYSLDMMWRSHVIAAFSVLVSFLGIIVATAGVIVATQQKPPEVNVQAPQVNLQLPEPKD